MWVKYHCYWLGWSWTLTVTLDLTSLAHHNSPERTGWHHVLTRHTEVHVQNSPWGRGGVKEGNHSQGKAAGKIWGKPFQSWEFCLWVCCLLHGSQWQTSVSFTSCKSGTYPLQSQRRRGRSMGWSAIAMAWATGPARSKSWKHLCRGLLQAVCAKREMAECCQNRDEMAMHQWVHLQLWESICSQQTTTEGNQSSATIHWRTCRISEKSNDRQITDLWEGEETSQSYCRDTETLTSSLQKEEQYVDKCTRTTTEDAPAYKPQETYELHTNTWRTEKAKESITSVSEGSEKRKGNRGTSVHREP